MNRRRFALALVLLTALAACGVADPDPVRVRVANASEAGFARVVVTFPEESVDYGSLPAGGASEYRSVAGAYPYARVEVYSPGGARMVLEPIDYVGVPRLRPGSYTYRLGVDTLQNGLTLQLVTD